MFSPCFLIFSAAIQSCFNKMLPLDTWACLLAAAAAAAAASKVINTVTAATF
jgi:hypothetical protein